MPYAPLRRRRRPLREYNFPPILHKSPRFPCRRRRYRHIYMMAPKAPYLASAAILYTSRGRKPGARPGGVSRSRTEPLAPRAERPGGAINPHARKGVSTFGNTGKHRPGPDPDRAERRLPSIFFSKGVHHESGRNYELTYPLRQHHHST